MPFDWGGTVSTVAGGVLAAGAGWLQSVRSSRDQKAAFVAEVKERRADSAWDRSYERAEEIVSIFRQIEDEAVNPRRISSRFLPNDREKRLAIERRLRRVEAASIYLPDPTRAHLTKLNAVLLSLDEMHERGFLDSWPRYAARTAIDSAVESVGRYMRQEPVVDPPQPVLDLIGEVDDYFAYVDDEIERQISDAEAEAAADREGTAV